MVRGLTVGYIVYICETECSDYEISIFYKGQDALFPSTWFSKIMKLKTNYVHTKRWKDKAKRLEILTLLNLGKRHGNCLYC